jgi:hypothetical protein
MNFLQYVQGPSAVGLDDVSRGMVTVHAARFLQINDRLSTVLMASNEQETIMRDPALNIFKAFGDLKHISVVPHLLVSRMTDFPKDLAQLAYANHSELVVIPFQPAKVIKEVSEPTSVSAWLNASEGPRPKVAEDTIVSNLNIFADQLIRKCRVKVAILVDAGLEKQSLKTVSILIPFFGGIDDRESLLLALRIGALRNVTIHVLHITIIDSQTKKPVNAGNMDLEDSKMIEYIQSLQKNGNERCIVTFEKAETSTPYDLVLSHLEKTDYSLVIVGHFGPFWTTTMTEEENDEAGVEEQNNGTVWSLSKIQATISSLSSNTEKEFTLKSKSSNSSLLEKVLGPTGFQIYERNPSTASLLVLRKFRVPE